MPSFSLNPHLAEQLAHDPEWQAYALEKAQEAVEAIRGLQRHGGLFGRDTTFKAVRSFDGASPAIVVSGSTWHLEEFGTPTTPPFAPIRRGMEAAGMTYRDV